MVERADDLDDGDNWTGGFYELCLVLGEADDRNLDRAVQSLWRAADVHGCRVRRASGSGFADVEPTVNALHEHGHLRGTLALPSGARTVCGGFVHRYGGPTPWSSTCRSARWPGSTTGSAAIPLTNAAVSNR
jgi:hypothetical protein